MRVNFLLEVVVVRALSTNSYKSYLDYEGPPIMAKQEERFIDDEQDDNKNTDSYIINAALESTDWSIIDY